MIRMTKTTIKPTQMKTLNTNGKKLGAPNTENIDKTELKNTTHMIT